LSKGARTAVPATQKRAFSELKVTPFKSGYGPEVDSIVNSANEEDAEYLQCLVTEFKSMDEDLLRPASELAPYLSFFSKEADPTNPPAPSHAPIPVEPWRTYAQVRGLTE